MVSHTHEPGFPWKGAGVVFDALYRAPLVFEDCSFFLIIYEAIDKLFLSVIRRIYNCSASMDDVDEIHSYIVNLVEVNPVYQQRKTKTNNFIHS